MRKAFCDTLVQVAERNKKVIFLTGDLGFGIFDDFRRRFTSRYVNIGVAEAQLMCAAAGLALEGWRPLAYSIASFATARPYEQIRLSICYHELPVVIVGAGGGFTYSESGVTHHSSDDLGLMSLLPGMTVVAPGSPEELSAVMPALFELKGPSYLRIGKFGEANYPAEDSALLGHAHLLAKGEKVAILSTGTIASTVMKACHDLARHDIHPLAYQFHTVKPLDTKTLDEISGHIHSMVVIEEHIPYGGLHSAICAWRVNKDTGPRVYRLGIPDQFVLGSPRQNELHARCNCDAGSIVDLCRRIW